MRERERERVPGEVAMIDDGMEEKGGISGEET